MSCVACGTNKQKYSKFRRMKSLNFSSEDKIYLMYKPIKKETEIILDRRQYKLGEFFLRQEVNSSKKRKSDYNNSEGYFKLSLSKIQQNQFDSRNMVIKKFRIHSVKKFKKCLIEFEPPLDYRWAFWYVISTSDQIISQDNYQRLVRSYKKEVESIVKKDVPRTFSSNKFFKNKIEDVEVGRELLYKVCKAVGTYFTEVGYCQGLNFLAGYLLQVSGANQMECVNVLISMMTNSRFLLLGLYDSSFPLVSFLKFLFHRKLKKVCNSVEVSLKKSMMPDDVWLTKWYISLMTGYLPKYHTARLLDFIISNDIFALVSFVLAIVLTNKKLFVGKEMEEINDVVSNLEAKNVRGEYLYLKEPSVLIKKAKRFMFSRDELLRAMEEFHEDDFSFGKEEFLRYEPHFKDYLLSGSSRQVEFKVFDFAAESVLPSVSDRYSHIENKRSFPRMKAIPNQGDIEEHELPFDVNSSPIKLKKFFQEEGEKTNSVSNEHPDTSAKHNRRRSSFFTKNERWQGRNSMFLKSPNPVYVNKTPANLN